MGCVRVATAVLFVVLVAGGVGQARADACEPLIPRTLANALAGSFPGYRVPLEYDNAPEDIDYSKSHGGTGCLGVATGDFTGDGKKDYVVGLTSVKGNAGLAVIALPQKGGWSFVRLQNWAERTRSSNYVSVVQPGEHGSVACLHSGVRIGTFEAAATVYCYRDGRWMHAAVAD